MGVRASFSHYTIYILQSSTRNTNALSVVGVGPPPTRLEKKIDAKDIAAAIQQPPSRPLLTMTKVMGENKRSFRIVSNSFGMKTDLSRYVNEFPLEAGRKAGRKMFLAADKMRMSSKTNNIVFIELEEITKTQKVAHSKERYYYKVERTIIPVAERKEKTFEGGRTFTPMYRYEVSSVKAADFPADHRG